jgi:hypothetical protein
MIDTRIPFLQKPVTPEALAEKMRAALEEPQDEPQEDLPDDSLMDEGV